VSDLILGLKSASDFYLAVDLTNGLLHTSMNKMDGLSLISFDERLGSFVTFFIVNNCKTNWLIFKRWLLVFLLQGKLL